MKLIVKTTSWGINRKSGKYKERVCGKNTFICKTGELDSLSNAGRRFLINETGDDYIKLSVLCANSAHNKEWLIKKGEELRYRPRSFDGGYFYDFKLI